MSKQEYPYMTIFLIAVAIIIAIGFTVSIINDLSNHDKETNYIENADCNSLEIYINAGRDGKDHFAFWTQESQETINFKITSEHVDEAQLKYQWECESSFFKQDLKDIRKRLNLTPKEIQGK